VASILGNLLGNAVKYAGSGARVSIEARVDSLVHVEVSDTGPGIAPELQARIFEPFVRGRKIGEGLGLGLATARRLVEAHGGAIGLRSNAGGSVFWFDLPPAKAPEASAAAGSQVAR